MALTNKLTAIGDAIREKTGKEDLLTLDQMPVEIRSIESGGGGYEPPEEALVLTGNCGHRFIRDGWTWFIEDFRNKITTKDITDASYMFQQCSKLKDVPFDINISNNCSSLNNLFSNCEKFTRVPLIKGELKPPTGNYSGPVNLSSLFHYCLNLREIPDDYFYQFGGEAFWEASKNYQGNRDNIFSCCYSLRKLPDISMLKTTMTSPYSTIYYINSLSTLDELINFPVLDTSTFTSNAFQNFAGSLLRAKNITFEVNEDGSPKTANWKNQTINLNNNVGYGHQTYHNNYILNYNSGITEDKRVYDDATYQALKDDPDWYVASAPPGVTFNGGPDVYSRYNHDSAVNTINSLPDTSAYLATNGGTNTITFLGRAGRDTDGGAISNLTEEEIAVAAAKGWTVTLA